MTRHVLKFFRHGIFQEKQKNNKAILFSDLIFEKADAEKDKNNTRKRPLVTGKRDYCSYPSHEITSHEKIQKLCTSLESLGQGLYMATLLRGNNFTSCDLFHTSTTNTKQVNKFALEDNSPTRQPVLEILATLSVMPLDNTNLTEDQETLVKKYLNVSVENLISIEKNTLHQSNCQMWYRERSIHLTASNFGAVLNRRKGIYPTSLLNKLKASGKKINTEACNWGIEKEVIACQKYEEEFKTMVTKYGLFINPKWPWLGCSPDGIVSKQKVIEIKCPFSKKDCSIIEACNDKHFFLKLVDDKPMLKETHNYYYQCQGIMAITATTEVDFVVLHKKFTTCSNNQI